MVALNTCWNRARRAKIWTSDSNYKELTKKLKTKTDDKFQALFSLSRVGFVYNIYAPFLVLAHKEKWMSFFVYKMDHKFPISELFGFKLKWEIHTDARKKIEHLILATTRLRWLKLTQLIVEYKSRCEKTNLLTGQYSTPYECLNLSLPIGVYTVHFEQKSTEK